MEASDVTSPDKLRVDVSNRMEEEGAAPLLLYHISLSGLDGEAGLTCI